MAPNGLTAVMPYSSYQAPVIPLASAHAAISGAMQAFLAWCLARHAVHAAASSKNPLSKRSTSLQTDASSSSVDNPTSGALEVDKSVKTAMKMDKLPQKPQKSLEEAMAKWILVTKSLIGELGELGEQLKPQQEEVRLAS